jgi:hypothetical protein
MSYEWSRFTIDGRRVSNKQAAARAGISANALQARLEAGYTHRQAIGLDPPPDSNTDVDCLLVGKRCAALNASYAPPAELALGGHSASLAKLLACNLRAWENHHRALVGDPAYLHALHDRPTMRIACGCTVDKATRVTVQPCAEHLTFSARLARRNREIRDGAYVPRVNVVQGI